MGQSNRWCSTGLSLGSAAIPGLWKRLARRTRVISRYVFWMMVKLAGFIRIVTIYREPLARALGTSWWNSLCQTLKMRYSEMRPKYDCHLAGSKWQDSSGDRDFWVDSVLYLCPVNHIRLVKEVGYIHTADWQITFKEMVEASSHRSTVLEGQRETWLQLQLLDGLDDVDMEQLSWDGRSRFYSRRN